jgi:hypothetical protein
MFGWLTGKSKAASYQVWLSESAKFNGIERSLRASADAGAAVVLVVHFDETASVLGAVMDEMGVPWSAVSGRDVPGEVISAVRACKQVVMVRGHMLDATRMVAAAAKGSGRARVVVVELHPMDDDAGRCTALAGTLPWETTVEYHTSLEDPVLRLFLNDATTKMLRTLGMDESTPIEHSMVDKAVARVQARVRSQVKRFDARPTAAQWLEHNCPRLAEKV